ncbi:hypothetical protein [Curtobacterium sp. Leaf261]|uniref:aggregation-promoting factor C-terminal-like domain-containing protein n=1 Tax=Curtobacterium sp. Leaf261 TaxID=1736311 RepID=UPI0006FF99D6|nr:hypothetical protein [Curtobacterium sp. Leaf261]KQO62426.1 hypothetical protein ASF23_11705 [Curtobacterium sp. Leaf261]
MTRNDESTHPTTTNCSTASPATGRTRREIRRRERATRRIVIASGALAVTLVAGGVLAVTTQPDIGAAIGLPTASPTPVMSQTDLAHAQAAATISTAKTVLSTANPATDTTALEHDIASLSAYRSLGNASLQEQIEDTVDTTTAVQQQSATDTKAQADAAAAAAAAAQAAADAAAAAEAAAEAQAAANTPAGAKATASTMASSDYGWDASQFSCLNSLWTKESGWNYRASNGSSGAYGIPQSLPGSKMSTIAADWQTNATTQVAWGLAYIKDAYGTPCSAWAHSQAYDNY